MTTLRHLSGCQALSGKLSGSGVVSARRIRSRRAGVLVPTHNIVLTFNTLDLPRDVLVGYVRVKVRHYFPSPMRCFRCLRFGHTRDFCRNRPTCGNCAATDHTSEDCAAGTRKCINCDDSQVPHSAFDSSCPAFLREKEIIAVMVTERVTFREARERYNSTHPRRSYANVVKETRASRPESAQQQQQQHGNISQLISLLQSFGLKLIGPGVPPGPMAHHAPQPIATALETVATQTSPTGGEVSGSDPGGGWTLVQRRSSGPTRTAVSEAPPTPPPSKSRGPPPAAAPQKEPERRRALETRRERSVERAKGTGAIPASSGAPSPQPPDSLPTERPPMGPPPPPPSLRRLPPPPPPKPTREAQSPTAPVPSAARLPAPPSEERPAKRSLPWDGSPTGGGSPRTRQRFRPGSTGGRSSSADGRLKHSRARIHFGEDVESGATQYF